MNFKDIYIRNLEEEFVNIQDINFKPGEKNPFIAYIQLILQSLELYAGEIDGIFGNNTKNAIQKFRESQNERISTNIDVELLSLLLPYTFVPTTIPYTYTICEYVLIGLKYKYPYIFKGSIGKSVMGKSLSYIKIGNGATNVLYIASTHANEWITTPLVLKFAEDYLAAYSNGDKIYNTYARDIYSTSSISIIPLVNPDGVDLVNNDINKESNYYLDAVKISQNYPNIRFPDGWKANINGIDLNLQFPAKWENAKEIKFKQGYISPAPRDFVGDTALQAIEAQALYNFTLSNNFKLMLTFHSQGKVIFWQFEDYTPPRAEEIGIKMSKASGYSLEKTPYASSFAGFKDWFIQNYNLPGYTIEVGLGINPLPISDFDEIYSEVLGIMVIGAKEA